MKLSLVFCCYNVSIYLDKVHQWLKEQPYQNIEVIFVEDCSTDNTKEKLKSLVNDSRMRIVENKINLGLSESRNVGLSFATGEYVGFPDPDDEFDIHWLTEVAEAFSKYKTDVLITGMREEYEIDGELKYTKNVLCYNTESSLFIKENFVDTLLELENTQLLGFMNNKFYNREFLLENEFRCKKLALKEDLDFNIPIFEEIDNFYLLNKPYYFYKKRNNSSLTNKFVPEYFDIHSKSVIDLKTLLEKKEGTLSSKSIELLVNRFFRFLLSAIERNSTKSSGLTSKEQQEWVDQVRTNPDFEFFFTNLKMLNGKLALIKFLFMLRNSYALVLLGQVISLIKVKTPILFSKLK